MSFLPTFSLGNYLPEDIDLIEDPQELRGLLKGILEDHSKMINRKDTGSYEEVEQLINQQYFGATPQVKRNVYRKVIATGMLPNAGLSAVAHGIAGVANTWWFTRIYGWALDPAVPRWIPMPNAGAAFQVQLDVTAANVNITTAVNLNAFTASYVILEYIKQ